MIEHGLEMGYFAVIDNYPHPEWKACVSLKYPWFDGRDKMFNYPELAPSKKLISDWREDIIDWEESEMHYRAEITSNEESLSALHYLIYLSYHTVVRVMCWEKNPPCHRFIIDDMVQEYDSWR